MVSLSCMCPVLCLSVVTVGPSQSLIISLNTYVSQEKYYYIKFTNKKKETSKIKQCAHKDIEYMVVLMPHLLIYLLE